MAAFTQRIKTKTTLKINFALPSCTDIPSKKKKKAHYSGIPV
jgi:hypothetical protein